MTEEIAPWNEGCLFGKRFLGYAAAILLFIWFCLGAPHPGASRDHWASARPASTLTKVTSQRTHRDSETLVRLKTKPYLPPAPFSQPLFEMGVACQRSPRKWFIPGTPTSRHVEMSGDGFSPGCAGPFISSLEKVRPIYIVTDGKTGLPSLAQPSSSSAADYPHVLTYPVKPAFRAASRHR
jgi:hypothetical protein